MGLDIRWPIGLMFTLIGAMLVIYGLATGSSEIYQRSLGTNVNLYWGLLLLVFGGWMLTMAWRASRQPQSDDSKPGDKH
jgi:hypothetical protein